jgi:hypothetical protein
VNFHQRTLQLHLIPHFHSHLNHPHMTRNFHHNHFQKIQVMHRYQFVTEQQDALSNYQSPPQFIQHQEEWGGYLQSLLVLHHVALPTIPPLYNFPRWVRACLSKSFSFLQQRFSSAWIVFSDHPIVTKYFTG